MLFTSPFLLGLSPGPTNTVKFIYVASPPLPPPPNILPLMMNFFLTIVFDQISQEVVILAVPISFLSFLAAPWLPCRVPQAQQVLQHLVLGGRGVLRVLRSPPWGHFCDDAVSWFLIPSDLLLFLFPGVFLPPLFCSMCMFSRLFSNPSVNVYSRRSSLAISAPPHCCTYYLMALWACPGSPAQSFPPTFMFTFLLKPLFG